ncbi:MAG: thioredoxin domain-containing protein [Deltaproteobacteria bacterium]|nr:thioredoxin domain-containing protein [Deltaproteobacteria bacterium]
MRRWGIYLVILAALGGGVLSAIALHQYVAISSVGLTTPSFCNISETFNCDIVTASSYATMFGVPTAGLALLFFAIQLLFGIWAALQRESGRGHATVGFLLGLGALIPSAWLVYVMAAILRTYCLSCLGVDLAILGIVLGWLGSRGVLIRQLTFRHIVMGPLVTILVIGAVGLLFLVNIGMATEGEGRRPSAAMIAEALQAFEQQPAQQIDIDASQHARWGAADAKVHILEISDFQCPFCKEAAFRIKPYLAEFRNDVQVTFLHYPLDSSCNPELQRSLHPMACLAARAAVCAEVAGRFWAYHDAIFHHQPQLSRTWLIEEAKRLGLDPERFGQCLDDPATDALVRRDIAIGRALQVAGTPSVYLNGRKLSGWQSKDFLRAAVRAEIAKQQEM